MRIGLWGVYIIANPIALSAEEYLHPRAVIVTRLPRCDFCSAKAEYEGKTRDGTWANMCEYHFLRQGIGLGVGKDQKLVEDKTQRTL